MKKTRRLQSRILTSLLYMLGFASPLMLVACYAPPTSELRYMEDEEVVDSLEDVVPDAEPQEAAADLPDAGQ